MIPHPGKFESLEKYNIHNGNILESLTFKWHRFIGVLRNAIIQKPITPLYQLEVCFGKEIFIIWSRSYRTFDISFILQLCMFGWGFSKMKSQEIFLRQIIFFVSYWIGESDERVIWLTWVVWIFFNKMGESSNAAGKWTQWLMTEEILLGVFWWYILEGTTSH